MAVEATIREQRGLKAVFGFDSFRNRSHTHHHRVPGQSSTTRATPATVGPIPLHSFDACLSPRTQGKRRVASAGMPTERTLGVLQLIDLAGSEPLLASHKPVRYLRSQDRPKATVERQRRG